MVSRIRFGKLLKGCGKAIVGVHGCRKNKWSWQLSFSAQGMCPYATGFAMMACGRGKEEKEIYTYIHV